MVEEASPHFSPYFENTNVDDAIGFVSYDLNLYNKLLSATVLKVIDDNIAPRDIPHEVIPAQPPVINVKDLRRFNMDEHLIPENAILANDSSTFWEQNRRTILISLFAILTIIVVFLLILYIRGRRFRKELAAAKRENKLRLAQYIRENMEIEVDPDSVFDVQVKRLHAYKRQLLNGFKILDLYNRLKADPNLPINNYTFIFAGKAAQGYVFAKEVIKFINSLADVINSDPDVNQKIKVVFIENFCVSNAQLIYPAADISEQISTAGKEASGTGNMKFMMNGAITLGTMDGANVEINQLVGDDNMGIFGFSSDEVDNFYKHGGYSAQRCIDNDPRLKRISEQLVNGFFSRCGYDFWGIHDALFRSNDEFFVLGDFDSYVKAWENMDKIYSDKERWNRMSLANIANSAFFSSDRTIREYAEEIWKAL